ncbi:hypothetical protein CGZ80_17300 [Rhodopirellula sp. MGV]|nr:hypothetical protein CGZ80_17300 [Rhodopirellula sp. MGV]
MRSAQRRRYLADCDFLQRLPAILLQIRTHLSAEIDKFQAQNSTHQMGYESCRISAFFRLHFLFC